MNSLSLYFHAGSANHGCEAIVRSTYKICSSFLSKMDLFSLKPEDDIFYHLDQDISIYSIGYRRYSLPHFIAAFKYKVLKNNTAYDELIYKNLWENRNCKIAMSIGGDNYCYGPYPLSLANINRRLNQIGVKTVLWGCSIEPELLMKPEILTDMRQYSLITARESITYNALIESGVSNYIRLYPDPAFVLDADNLDLPPKFIEKRTIGINVSPLVQRLENIGNITYQNYRQLIKYIIKETENNVALIPHVIWAHNNDYIPLTQLYNDFKDTGRVILIEDHNCMELKGFISRCRMFIGARTHATIAAYSTCVPTLVLGYSVKAKGIAKDIFGTYENYVLPVQDLKSADDLVNAFKWLMQNEDKIRHHLQQFMPGYIEKAWQAGEEVKKMIESPIP